MICGARKMTALEKQARGCQKPEGGDRCAVLPGRGVPSLSGDCLAALGPATCRNGAEAMGGQSQLEAQSPGALSVWVPLAPMCFFRGLRKANF